MQCKAVRHFTIVNIKWCQKTCQDIGNAFSSLGVGKKM